MEQKRQVKISIKYILFIIIAIALVIAIIFGAINAFRGSKIDEINAIKAKASSLEAEQSELLAEEEEIDRKLTQAFDNADKDLLSATQSLEKIVASINETQGRLTEKRRMLEQLNKVTR